jgi:hypothetical protein
MEFLQQFKNFFKFYNIINRNYIRYLNPKITQVSFIITIIKLIHITSNPPCSTDSIYKATKNSIFQSKVFQYN